MVYVVEIDCICLFILCFIFINLHQKRNSLSYMKYFFYCVICTMSAIFSDILSLLVESDCLGFLSRSIPFNYAINVIYYSATILATYFWFLNCAHTANHMKWTKKYFAPISSVIADICIILIFISVHTGWFFTIAENNTYERGPFFFVNNIGCYIYAVAACAHSLIAAVRETDYIKKQQFRVLAAFILFPIFIALIQIFIPSIPTIHVGMTIPIWFVYTELQELQITLDFLTGLNNRTQLMRYINKITKVPSRSKNLYMFMADIDKFKKINDTYGHHEGDHALVIAAEILKETAKGFGGFVARYGGDEFTLVTELDNDDSAVLLKKAIENSACEHSKDLAYNLSISVGFCKYKPGMKVSEWFYRADSKMYVDKKKIIGK